MSLLAEILFVVSRALFAPVMILLVLLLAWTVYSLGAFFRDWLERMRARPLRRALGSREAAQLVLAAPRGQRLPSALAELASWLGQEKRSALEVERFLDETEARLSHQIEAVSLASKIGPMLGLAGTLIPLGPALAGLGSGNLSQLLQNLTVAFTATVVGLAIGGPCFAITLTWRRWSAELMRDMEFVYRSHLAFQEEAVREDRCPAAMAPR